VGGRDTRCHGVTAGTDEALRLSIAREHRNERKEWDQMDLYMTQFSYTAEAWTEGLEEAGLKEVVGGARRVDMRQESEGRIERYGCRGSAKPSLKTLALFLENRKAREFLQGTLAGLSSGMLNVVENGLYSSQKCSSYSGPPNQSPQRTRCAARRMAQ
jgi:hypothetical protein